MVETYSHSSTVWPKRNFSPKRSFRALERQEGPTAALCNTYHISVSFSVFLPWVMEVQFTWNFKWLCMFSSGGASVFLPPSFKRKGILGFIKEIYLKTNKRVSFKYNLLANANIQINNLFKIPLLSHKLCLLNPVLKFCVLSLQPNFDFSSIDFSLLISLSHMSPNPSF